MYYYLHELKGYDIRIVGLDLKEDVIRHCSRLAGQYGYDKLTFLVTLHACDTATDYALAKAVGWNAKVILSVPCCQHELNIQFAEGAKGNSGEGSDSDGVRELLAPVMDYGLLRERFAALVTDGLRAKYLERAGYETQVLEFIDMEHTPKNILLRAVKRNRDKIKDAAGENTAVRRAAEDIVKCEQFLQASPTLGRLLSDIKGE